MGLQRRTGPRRTNHAQDNNYVFYVDEKRNKRITLQRRRIAFFDFVSPLADIISLATMHI